MAPISLYLLVNSAHIIWDYTSSVLSGIICTYLSTEALEVDDDDGKVKEETERLMSSSWKMCMVRIQELFFYF